MPERKARIDSLTSSVEEPETACELKIYRISRIQTFQKFPIEWKNLSERE